MMISNKIRINMLTGFREQWFTFFLSISVWKIQTSYLDHTQLPGDHKYIRMISNKSRIDRVNWLLRTVIYIFSLSSLV